MINTVRVEEHLNLESISEGILSDVEYKYLKEFCNLVVCKNFSYVKSFDREDLISVGVLKCLDLIRAGKYDHKRNSLKNYLWTGARNEMTNFLYKSSKEFPVEEVFPTSLEESPRDFTAGLFIKLKDIEEYLVKFHNRFIQYSDSILAHLYLMEVPCETPDPDKVLEDTKTVGRLTCLYLWKRLENYPL